MFTTLLLKFNQTFFRPYRCTCNIAVLDGLQTREICFVEFHALLNRVNPLVIFPL